MGFVRCFVSLVVLVLPDPVVCLCVGGFYLFVVLGILAQAGGYSWGLAVAGVGCVLLVVVEDLFENMRSV